MDKKIRYHLIEPGTPEFEIAKELYDTVTMFNQKYEIMRTQFNNEVETLNNEYLPRCAEIRKRLYPAYTDKDPDHIERDGGMQLATQFFEDTGVFMMIEVEDVLPPSLSQLLDFSPPSGKAN